MSVILRNYMKLFMRREIAPCGATSIDWFCGNDIILRHKSDEIIHREGDEPPIPVYVEREGENIELKKARLVYQSRKRGMSENGLVLSTFAKKYLHTFNEHQLRLYDNLINIPSNDWDLFYWAAGVKETPNEFNHEIMDLLKKHVRNDDRQSRIVQPDL